MTAAMTGTTWQVLDVALLKNGRPRGDGDTVNVQRTSVAQLGDDWFRLTDTHPDGSPKHVPVRLAWVDTPERGTKGYADADRDLDEWIMARWGRLRVVCYKSAGWDRLLVDLIDDTGASASQYLMAVKGWPMYTGDKA